MNRKVYTKSHGISSPCLNCKDRHQACHASCKLYSDYATNLKEANDKIKKAKKDSGLCTITKEKSLNKYRMV